MDFTQSKFSLADLIFQGATEHEPTALCNEAVLEALDTWQSRPAATEPGTDIFRLEHTRSFAIRYDGEASEHWPDEDSNWLGETLVREFLFREGICLLEGFEPRLYLAKYKIEAVIDREYLLVCPYPTESGNIGGMTVVCVNQHLKPGTSR
ncbi:MAG: hypothetical protein AAGE85_07930 [Pseudomonadota bacterium]